jgi:hypothetical protein
MKLYAGVPHDCPLRKQPFQHYAAKSDPYKSQRRRPPLTSAEQKSRELEKDANRAIRKGLNDIRRKLAAEPNKCPLCGRRFRRMIRHLSREHRIGLGPPA